MQEKEGKNRHYSNQTGHLLRGRHQDVMQKLGGFPPESVPGFDGIEGSRIRRSMRRIPRDGKK